MNWFKSNKSNLQWIELSSINDLDKAIDVSQNRPVLIFKHSTRCSISSMAKNRLEGRWEENTTLETYFLDLITNRDLSNDIAEQFKIEHQSPQILIIKDGKCIYTSSHNEINYDKIKEKFF